MDHSKNTKSSTSKIKYIGRGIHEGFVYMKQEHCSMAKEQSERRKGHLHPKYVC